MQSIDLIRDNLEKSASRVLARIEDMKEHAFVLPTAKGGGHTLWVLGHLAFVEGLVVHGFMMGEPNPLADQEPLFDGDGVPPDPTAFPPFEEVLATCRDMRARTLALLDSLVETDLDRECASVPTGYSDTFGTFRLCLQYLADHWYMHRGQLAAARRAAGLERMWV